jgi:hypothetical protein
MITGCQQVSGLLIANDAAIFEGLTEAAVVDAFRGGVAVDVARYFKALSLI